MGGTNPLENKKSLETPEISETMAKPSPDHVHAEDHGGSAIGGHIHGPDCHHGHHHHGPHHNHDPYVRTSPKIGRNDPCSCGSGKKFKKCCGGVKD